MSDANEVKVWDLPVRLFHWSLVIAFFTAYFSADELEGVHVVAGYAISGLLLFRILWGFVGSEHARFRDFIFGPSETINYLKGFLSGRPRNYLGHNPAGAIMVFLLLIFLSLTCLSGLKTYAVEGGETVRTGAPSIIASAYANGDEGEDEGNGGEGGEEFWEEVHEISANTTLALVIAHIAGALAASYIHRQNLIKAMITGRKSMERR